MRKLQRPAMPPILKSLRNSNPRWRDISKQDRGEIRAALFTMTRRGEQSFCSYCEELIHPNKGHIEHLEPRKTAPLRTYDWTNLFLSCDSTDNCGHFKDRPGRANYRAALLIHPDVDNPDDYLRFFSDGHVEPRPGLTDGDRKRADQTIDALNLNSQSLVARRFATMKSIRALVLNYIDELGELSREELLELFEDELKSLESSPFYTTARHFFQWSSSTEETPRPNP